MQNQKIVDRTSRLLYTQPFALWLGVILLFWISSLTSCGKKEESAPPPPAPAPAAPAAPAGDTPETSTTAPPHLYEFKKKTQFGHEELTKYEKSEARTPASKPLSGSTGGEPFISSVDKFLQSLDVGNFVFNCAEKMRMSESYIVAAVLSGTRSFEELEREIGQYGKVEQARIRISNKMEAHLDGLNFQIRSLTPTVQAIAKSEPNEWKWEVKPIQKGEQKLHLSVNVYVTEGGKENPHVIRTFERTITVEVTTTEIIVGFLRDNWQWVMGTLIIPLVVYLWQKRKKRKKPKK